MKIVQMKLCNFRSYKDEVIIDFNDLTAFVGKNDIGKSSVLEALDIFFNEGKGTIKLDKDDINKENLLNDNNEITIAISFTNLPNRIIIDSTNETTLDAEYLLNQNSELEIIKKFPNAGKEKVFIKALHPNNPLCKDLLNKKDTELRGIIGALNIECPNRTKNALMRTSIWNNYADSLQKEIIEIDVSKGDTKSIWEKLQKYLPLYTLFQSDRKNSDGDSEVQDPLQLAVKQIIGDETLQIKFNEIAVEVERKLTEVSTRTLNKLREMNPEIANSLVPIIPSSESLKWKEVFKNVSISSDDNIPVNKRGSGVKRLILLNFFRAEAERRREESNIPSIVYAIEEPETSQHTRHIKQLIRALISLAETLNTQIVITTHSPALVKELNFENLRLISKNNEIKSIQSLNAGQLPYPSLNEVNYLAFSEVSEEYHNELYGYVEAEGLLNEFKNEKQTMNYIKQTRNGCNAVQIILTEYVRHQIHHPENTMNQRFTEEQLCESICMLRDFIHNRE
jgi:predicted ATP-dependent endonuclease of OLD family